MISERTKVVATIGAVFALVALPSIAFAPSDPDARCREVLAHRSTLGSRSEQTSDALESAVAKCRESIGEKQAKCATSALSLDEFERCFM